MFVTLVIFYILYIAGQTKASTAQSELPKIYNLINQLQSST